MTTDNIQRAQSKEVDSILELDRDKLYLVADTFSSATMYLHSGLQHGYIGLNGPDLYSFQLPHPDVQHNGVTEIQDNFDMLYEWEKENVYEVNMIEPEDEDKLGVLQHDPETGELYMFIPLEIDALLQPDEDIDFSNNYTINVPNNNNFQMETAEHYPTGDPNDIRNIQNIQVQDQSMINDRKDNIVNDLDGNSLIGLKSDPPESPDLNNLPQTDTNIVLNTDLNDELINEDHVEAKPGCSELTIHADPEHKTSNIEVDAEPVEEIGAKLVPSDSMLTLSVLNPEEKLSQVTLMRETEQEQELEPEPIKEDEPVADCVTNICNVVLPKMSLKFSLAFNFDEICICPTDYEGKRIFGNRKIYDFHKLPNHKKEHGGENNNNNNNNDKDDDKIDFETEL